MNESFLIERLEKEADSLPSSNNEIIQHLVELGYLPLLRLNALNENDITKAKLVFLEDLLSTPLLTQRQITAQKTLDEEAFLTYFLRKSTDIDEGLVIQQLPVAGSTGLAARLIHYRLELLGLWQHPIDSAFSNTSIIAIEQLASYLKTPALDAINMASDIESLTKHLLEVREDQEFILTFQVPEVDSEDVKRLERRRAFKRQMKQDFEEKNDFFKKLNKDVLRLDDNKIDYGFLHKESRIQFKKFVARLIQIHQWQDGFYQNLLDSNIGPFTLKSTLQTIDFYNQLSKKNIKTHRVLTYLDRGYFVFNALFFLQEYMIEEKTQADEEELWGRLAEKVKQSDNDKQAAFSKNMEEIKVSLTQQTAAPRERKGLLQRVYAGIKKIIKKALRFFNKIFKWLTSSIRKVFQFLKKIFKSFFETLSNGIKAFLNGIKFLIGKKQIVTTESNGFIYSRWQMDADVFSLANHASLELIKAHLKQSNYEWATLRFALVVVGSILEIVTRSLSILSWPFLVLTIARTFKKISVSYQSTLTN